MDTKAVVELLREMVAFPTVSSESNLALADYLRQKLEAAGFSTELHPNSEGDKANLLASAGPPAEGGILLAGHLDVVPVSNADWDGDPFRLEEREDHVQGRGVSDMKGFWAVVVALCQQVDLNALRAPLHLVLTYDEEVGCEGAKALADRLRALSPRPRLALLGEPTSNEVVVAHRGLRAFRTVVTGRAAHASRPRLGASALHAACELVTRLSEVLPEEQDDRFDPPGATANVGVIEGGVATNVVADSCAFEWEVRTRTWVEMEQVAAGWQRLVEDTVGDRDAIQVETQLLTEVPPLEDVNNQDAARAIQSAMGKSQTTTAPYVTEGGIIDATGIPAIICGPGAIEQAHQTNEKLSISALAEHGKGLERLLAELF